MTGRVAIDPKMGYSAGSLLIAEEFGCCAFRLMVKRGPW
jgi:hypothetical protein